MNKYVKVGISLLVGLGFLWFAFKDVEFSEIVEASKGASWGWFLPFAALTLFSHFIRAERWRMLFEDKANLPHRSTLFTGVMFGYLTNIAFPRLGEITRPVYVARQIDESNSKLIGTVVLERIVDVLSMLIIMVLVGIFLISDAEVLSNLFGTDVTDPEVYFGLMKAAALYGGILLIGGFLIFFVLNKLSSPENKLGQFFAKLSEGFKNFAQGVLAIKDLENWPLFIFHTALIWVCYITMTYIPFFMFDMTNVFDLSYTDAIVLTMVSAVGISIPTPGGVGSYHIFIKLALLYLYAVPEATGLAFATIAHAATLVVIVTVTPVLLAVEKRLSMGRESQRITNSE
jgi:hypothetical protein